MEKPLQQNLSASATLTGDPARYRGGLQELRNGITGWLQPNGGWGESNAGLVAGHRESLLVDTLWDLQLSRRMLSALSGHLKTAPIRTVVNTHSDGDHWWGNQLTQAREIIATERAARVMAHEGPELMKKLSLAGGLFRCLGHCLPGSVRRARCAAIADYFAAMMQPFVFKDIRPTLPTSTFSGIHRMEVGGRAVELIEVGPAHTAGDLVVVVPDARVLFAGDIVFLGTTPVMWEGPLRNWIAALETILKMDVEVIVPGHGPVTDKAGIELLRGYWVWLERMVQREHARGTIAPEACARIANSDEFHHRGYAGWECPERLVVNVHTLYRERAGKTSPPTVLDRLRIMSRMAVAAKDFPDAARVCPRG